MCRFLSTQAANDEGYLELAQCPIFDYSNKAVIGLFKRMNKALLRIYRALLWIYGALLWISRALLFV